jgi:hypothetical protein
MLRVPTLPGALTRVLATVRPCFTAPTFEVFTALVAGLFTQPVSRTVCGMLTGAGLARAWHHSRAHRFFSTTRWQPHQVGLLLGELIVTSLLAPDAPITVAVDDTLFRRRGKKIHAVGWFHDGSAAGQAKLGFGNNWVVLAVIVTLPFLSRPVALPVLASLAVKGGQSKPDLARDLLDAIAERFPDRDIHLVADTAYGCNAFAGLGHGMTITTRARTNAVFSHLAHPAAANAAGHASKANGSVHQPTSPDQHGGRPSRCPATAGPTPSRSPNRPACGTAPGAPTPSGSSWCATPGAPRKRVPPAATTSR